MSQLNVVPQIVTVSEEERVPHRRDGENEEILRGRTLSRRRMFAAAAIALGLSLEFDVYWLGTADDRNTRRRGKNDRLVDPLPESPQERIALALQGNGKLRHMPNRRHFKCSTFRPKRAGSGKGVGAWI
jgi:hypothetical protein